MTQTNVCRILVTDLPGKWLWQEVIAWMAFAMSTLVRFCVRLAHWYDACSSASDSDLHVLQVEWLLTHKCAKRHALDALSVETWKRKSVDITIEVDLQWDRVLFVCSDKSYCEQCGTFRLCYRRERLLYFTQATSSVISILLVETVATGWSVRVQFASSREPVQGRRWLDCMFGRSSLAAHRYGAWYRDRWNTCRVIMG
jgi:hypothetical protein